MATRAVVVALLMEEQHRFGSLRWAIWLQILAVVLIMLAYFLAWQVSSSTYPSGSFVYSYYFYGTQSQQIANASSCATTHTLPLTLSVTGGLVILAGATAVFRGVFSRAACRDWPLMGHQREVNGAFLTISSSQLSLPRPSS